MANNFTPRTDAQKTPWFKNLAAKLPAYAAKYGITAAEVADVVAIATDWDYRMDVINKVTAYKEAMVKWKNYVLNGAPAGAVVTMPAPPMLGTPPAASAPGGLARVSALAQDIKRHKSYSEADGRDLGIEGPDAVMLDMDAQKPQITLKTGTAGRPKLGWLLAGMGGLNIYKDSDDGRGYVFYARDNHPDYEDTAPLPATAKTWKYKCIYVIGDEEVGQFSDPVTVKV